MKVEELSNLTDEELEAKLKEVDSEIDRLFNEQMSIKILN